MTQEYTLSGGFPSVEELTGYYEETYGALKLDLGCGYYKPSGYIGVDNLSGAATQIENEENVPDIFMDLNNGDLPFNDSSCDEVRSSHFLEHSNLDHIIKESHRVLKPGGKFIFTVPYANSAEGMYPGHHIFLTEKWFYNNIGFQERFEIVKEKYYRSRDYLLSPIRFFIPFPIARKFLFNACWQMKLTCNVRK